MKEIQTLLYKASRKPTDKINIGACCIHERWETNFCKIPNIEVWSISNPQFKPGWNESYAPIPSNYHVLNSPNFPDWLNLDIIMAGNIFGAYQILAPIARKNNINLLRVEHTCVPDSWSKEYVNNLKNATADISIYISEFTKNQWNDHSKDKRVIHHMVDTNLFCPKEMDRKNVLLCVCNDFVNRDQFLGYSIWKDVVEDLPYELWGDTKELGSKPPSSVDELVSVYNNCSVYLNTTTQSVVPYSLLEAASMELGIISTRTAAIPEFFTHEHDSFLSNDVEELRQYAQHLLANPTLAREMGKKARQTILEKCREDNFISKWNDVISCLV